MSDALIYVVDDDPIMQEVMRDNTEALARIECFADAEACAERIHEAPPDLLLLDIGLPGMDGYTFCRQLKDDGATKDIPVIFVSAHDTVEERLAGYDAGAEDFIVKPFDPAELARKVGVAMQLVAERKSYREQLSSADQLTSLALASMDEAGVVLQFMGKLVAWETDAEIAQGLLELMQRMGVDGAVQTRVGERAYTLSSAGTNLPLEVSVLNHVRTLERIFEFRKRAVFNFDRVTLMVHQMPDDNDVCGRIRDNLAIAAQGADSRLAALAVAEARQRDQATVFRALETLKTTLVEFRDSHQQHRARSSALTFDMEQDLAKSFVHLGLTTGQERFLEEMMSARIAELMQVLDKGDEMERILSQLLDQLSDLTSQPA